VTVYEAFWKELLAGLPCALASRAPGTCSGRVELHHVAQGSGKRSTFAMVPMCSGHHREFHPQVGGAGTRGFLRRYRPPGESEYGLLVWALEDLAKFLRERIAL